MRGSLNGSFWTSGSFLFALRKEAVHGDLPPSLSGPPFGWVDSWMGVRGWGARNWRRGPLAAVSCVCHAADLHGRGDAAFDPGAAGVFGG